MTINQKQVKIWGGERANQYIKEQRGQNDPFAKTYDAQKSRGPNEPLPKTYNVIAEEIKALRKTNQPYIL